MKKILLVLFTFLAFVSTVFAVEMYFSTTKFETNDGIVRIPDFNIDFEDESFTGFEIILSDSNYVIFDNNLDNLRIEDIEFDASLSDDHKRAMFSGDFAGDFKVEGLYLRIYDREDRVFISMNYTGDNEADANFDGYIKIEENDDNNDRMKPIGPKDITYSMTGSYVLFEWTASPDLDLTYTLITLEKDGGFYKNIKIGGKDTSYKANLDLEDHDREITVSVRDIYYASDSISLEILREETPYCIDNMRLAVNPEETQCKAFYNTCDVPEEWTVVEDCSVYDIEDDEEVVVDDDEDDEEEDIACIQVIQDAKNPETGDCQTFSTPCEVPSGWINVDSCDTVTLLEKKIYTFEREFFELFQTKFDELIERKTKNFDVEKKNEIINVRNGIMLTLKNYDSGLITKAKTIRNLTVLIKKYSSIMN